MRRTPLVCVLALLLSPAAMRAQAPADQSDVVRTLLERIDQLERRVAQLEAAQKAAVSATPTAPVPAAAPVVEPPTPPVSEASGEQPLQNPSIIESPILKIVGFSDIDFSAADAHGSKSGFNEGQFVLHLSSILSPRVSVFGELTLSARNDAGLTTVRQPNGTVIAIPSVTGFNAEVERIFVRYDESDALKVSFGRYHTPINYWNMTFHHGLWLQTTVARPAWTSSILPVHFVGGLAEGRLPTGGLNLNYDVGMGNGRSSIFSRAGDFGDVNNNKAWLVNLFAKPDKPFGLLAGGGVYRDEMTLENGRNYREWIGDGYIVWTKESPEFIAEAMTVNHRAAGSSHTWNTQAWYTQFAYRLPGEARAWKPYYRFEYLHVPRTDPVIGAIPTYWTSLAGVRYDISHFAAFKAEWRHQKVPNLRPINGAFLQTAFTF